MAVWYFEPVLVTYTIVSAVIAGAGFDWAATNPQNRTVVRSDATMARALRPFREGMSSFTV